MQLHKCRLAAMDPALLVRALLIWALAMTTAPSLFGQMQSAAVSRLQTNVAQDVRLPEALEDIGFEQRLGAQIPLDLEFEDHDGQRRPLSTYFADRPVLLAPVYYECPMLCSLVLDGVVRTLRPLSLDPGSDLQVLAVSFDPEETSKSARGSRDMALSRYRRDGTEQGWSFLVGDQESTEALMEAIGFKYRYDPETDLYAHAGGIVLLTPEGQVSRYFYGVDFAPKDVRLGLVEASDNKIGSVIDQVLLFCFQYDPAIGKYSAVAMNIVRLGGVLTVLFIGSFLALMWRRDRRHRSPVSDVPAPRQPPASPQELPPWLR